MSIKALLPAGLKIQLHLLKNKMVDLKSGYLFKFSKINSKNKNLPNQHSIIQYLKSVTPNKAKNHNLQLAIGAIETVQINPGAIFSFWEIVGNPTKNRGFVESRSIMDGVLIPSVGGGLCQLSGIIYHLAIQTDLEIIERFNHSKDIYTEEERYTPLGSDATVVYAYKDLKLRNNTNSPIHFSFDLKDLSLEVRLHSSEKITTRTIEFIRQSQKDNTQSVLTIVDGKEKYISRYRI